MLSNYQGTSQLTYTVGRPSPGGASGKEPTCQCRRRERHIFNPRVRKIPWRRKWQPSPVSLLGESHGQRSLEGNSLWGCKESGMTEWARSGQTTAVFKCWPKGITCYPVNRDDHEWYLYLILFLTALGLCGCVQAFSNCGERGCSLGVVCALPIAVPSLVAEHGL